MNNLMMKLRKHKANNTGLLILMILSITFIGIKFIEIYNNSFSGNRISELIFGLSTLVIFSLVSLWYERNKLSVVAHLVFFIGFLEPYLRDFYQSLLGASTNTNFLVLILGVVATIYIILKIFAHNSELRSNLPTVNRQISFLLIISLINVYFVETFSNVLVYLLIIILAMSSSNGKGALPVVILIYAQRLVATLNSAYLISGSQGLNTGQKINVLFNLLFIIIIIFYTIRLLKHEDRYYRY